MIGVPQLHPNGFIQLPLDDDDFERLHIWAPDVPEAQKVSTPIHDHTFDFRSTILLGRLRHTLYRITSPNPTATHTVWVPHGEELVTMEVDVTAEVDKSFVFGQGASYVMSAGEYHTSAPDDDNMVATLMYKSTKKRILMSGVLVPVGTEPDNTFRRDQYSISTLMPFVFRAMRAMSAQGKWVYEVGKIMKAVEAGQNRRNSQFFSTTAARAG